MGVLTGPLFSLSASGSIAKTITYSRWKGIKYARQRVIPANPKSTLQVEVRNVFSQISDYWARGTSTQQAPYVAAAKGKPYTDRNLLVKMNAALAYQDAHYDAWVGSPGTPGMPPAPVPTVTPGASQLTVAFTPAPAPSGFGIVQSVCELFENVNPTIAPPTFPTVHENLGGAGAYSHVFAGLTTGVTYSAVVWTIYNNTTTGETVFGRSAIQTGIAA